VQSRDLVAVRLNISTIRLLRNGQDKQGLGWLNGVLRQDEHHGRAHALLADYYRRKGNIRLADYHQKQAMGGTPRVFEDRGATEPRPANTQGVPPGR
jgi:Tfp pilus assembly protein PilF